jgi:uncharacterized membrane protein YdfJ with MMPL/SSD domain
MKFTASTCAIFASLLAVVPLAFTAPSISSGLSSSSAQDKLPSNSTEVVTSDQEALSQTDSNASVLEADNLSEPTSVTDKIRATKLPQLLHEAHAIIHSLAKEMKAEENAHKDSISELDPKPALTQNSTVANDTAL